MKVVRGSQLFPKRCRNPVVTLGNFDGVHRGHQTILAEVVRQAKKRKGTPVVYTYNPHPVSLLAPHEAPPMIQTPQQRLESITKNGISICVIEKFTHRFAQMKPEQFFERVILKRLRPIFIIVGYDFTFGYKRSGTTELLENFCRKHGIGYEIIPALFAGDKLLSSTQIRKYLVSGLVEDATKMLGRHYTIEGTVKKGRGIGRHLGFHTANIRTNNELIPPQGVYISQTKIAGKKNLYQSITNIGFNPTFGGKSISIETHILDFNSMIYGKKIDVEFIRRLRPEMLFDDPSLLSQQIHRDIETAKRFFKGSKKS